MQPVDYLDAHERHWEDAELLLGHARVANADHLFGMSAECGLKHVMHRAGYLVLASGMPQHKEDRGHADAYWTRYVTLASGKSVPVLHTDNPFTGWSVHQRYAPRTVVTAAAVETIGAAPRPCAPWFGNT